MTDLWFRIYVARNFSKINWLHGRGPIWQWSPPYIASHRNCISLRDLSKIWNNFTSSDPYWPDVCFFLWDNLTCAHPCHILLAFSLTLYLAFFSFIFPRIFATIWIYLTFSFCNPSDALPASSDLGCPIPCGKFLFPAPYLPVAILDVRSPMVNSSPRRPTCQLPSWMSDLLW